VLLTRTIDWPPAQRTDLVPSIMCLFSRGSAANNHAADRLDFEPGKSMCRGGYGDSRAFLSNAAIEELAFWQEAPYILPHSMTKQKCCDFNRNALGGVAAMAAATNQLQRSQRILEVEGTGGIWRVNASCRKRRPPSLTASTGGQL
jgi:hypothetical protein